MISVIIPTNRIGGLDILFGSLAAQTYQDFELILVDNVARRLLDWRSPEKRAKYLTLPAVKHIEPRDNPFPRTAYCRSVNSGLEVARGDVVFLTADYSFLHPDCLATHAKLQAKHHCPIILDYDMAKPPMRIVTPFYGQSLSPDNPGYQAELTATTERYVADLNAGKLDPYMWSIFREPLAYEAIQALEVEHKHRPCSTREPDDYNWCSFKNESFPIEVFEQLNGLDEEYDKSHTYQDSEFSYRMREAGIRWQNGPAETGMLTIVNPRRFLNIKTMAEPISANQERCFGSRRAELRLPVNPGWSLRDARKAHVKA